jgi:hypothetical protein
MFLDIPLSVALLDNDSELDERNPASFTELLDYLPLLGLGNRLAFLAAKMLLIWTEL